MNRLFFGDTRDLFTYDLVRHIMKALPVFDSFTFIPMLSNETVTKSGSVGPVKDLEQAVRDGKAGSQNRELMVLLVRLQEIDSPTEYFTSVQDYFNQEKIGVKMIGCHPFTHAGRNRYFGTVLTNLKRKSLIFLDPDIGIEERRASQKHLLFEEIQSFSAAMDTGSVLMIYQHLPRKGRKGYIRKRSEELASMTGCLPLTINDHGIVFFFLARSERLQERLEDVLVRYANSYPDLEFCGCDIDDGREGE